MEFFNESKISSEKKIFQKSSAYYLHFEKNEISLS